MMTEPVKKIRASAFVTGLLVLAMMAVIFLFSAQTAEESSKVSVGLLHSLIGWFRPLVEGIAGRPLDDLALENVLRKLGHFTEYAALGGLCWLHLRTTARRYRRSIAWGASVLYAVTDELHQTLSDGRAASVTDVCIDAAGALLGIFVMTGLFVLFLRTRRRKQAPAEG